MLSLPCLRTRLTSRKSESLLPTPGGSALPAWAGSLERFMTEFVHGRGLGILHPNLNGKVSFARRVPCESAEMVEREKEDPTEQVEPTSAPTLRGGEDVETQEPLVETYKDATRALVSAITEKLRVLFALNKASCTMRKRVCDS